MPESFLDTALQKLARQITAYDEASLMDLWEAYAEKIRHFEPTRRWEEAAVVFGIIQSVRMKNQLFNYHLAAARKAGSQRGPEVLDLTAPEAPQGGRASFEEKPSAPAELKSAPRQRKPKAGKLIPLRPGEKH